MLKTLAGLTLWLVSIGTQSADLAKGISAANAGEWGNALSEFRPLALKGDSDAQANLGSLYLRGLGVEQDYRTAMQWFDKAARQGNAAAQAKLGLMHYYGLGIEPDHTEAAHWFLKAAERGNPEAAMVLADLNDQGDGIPTNKNEAYFWYSVASDLGKDGADTKRAILTDQLSPSEINANLTRLSIWREHHDQKLMAAAKNTQNPTAEGGSDRHNLAGSRKKPKATAKDAPDKKPRSKLKRAESN